MKRPVYIRPLIKFKTSCVVVRVRTVILLVFGVPNLMRRIILL